MTKAIFLDIDGTLVSFRTHTISDSTMDCLYRLRKQGIRLFIASGRHRLTMDNLSGFPFDGYVAMNGALVTVDGRTISKTPIDPETARNIAMTADREGIPCVTYGEETVAINMRNAMTEKIFSMIKLPQIPDISCMEMTDGPVFQFTIFADKDIEARMLERFEAGLEPSRWHPLFMDLNPKGLSKADGIDAVLRYFGFSREESMAFGDGGNDISMLKAAGTGIAMGNASEDVKQAADHVTASVDDDGIAKALKHFGIL